MEDMNFEELRSQFATLKEQLQKQEIVSDHLLRETMKAKNRDINTTKRTLYICVALCLILFPLEYYSKTWSLPFIIATCVMVLGCAIATHYMHKPVERLNFMNDDFATVARVMARFKKQYNQWLHYATPALMIPWLAWACYDFTSTHQIEGHSRYLVCIPLLIGAAIGFAIGYHYHCKAVNAAQDIMNEIEGN